MKKKTSKSATELHEWREIAERLANQLKSTLYERILYSIGYLYIQDFEKLKAKYKL